MEALITALVSGGLAIVGAWAGHRWAENAAKDREARTERKQADSVRLLLTLEIDQNLVALNAMWAAFQESNQIPRSLAGLAPLVGSSSVWDSQIGVMAIAFDELTLARISRVYRALSEISTIHARLIEMHGQDQITEGSVPDNYVHGLNMGPRLFSRALDSSAAFGLMELWRETVVSLLSEANPLRHGEPVSEPTEPTT